MTSIILYGAGGSSWQETEREKDIVTVDIMHHFHSSRTKGRAPREGRIMTDEIPY